MGYATTTIRAGFKYKTISGLMKQYVEFLFKNKTCTSAVKPAEGCFQLNESHTALCLYIHITPAETAFSLGIKQIAKLCLNPVWGTFGQRSGTHSFEYLS
jgi:hypothetical protein